ncbi:hypothetical protein Zmor_022723 [Zophobas morio]|uniref:Uncharacterized protein n=1 Tax=Zophobas morio TaxID=2755281 RepID=A0AA38HWM2_9CUCU|nr:hypothetical protein Zmor_022723 [Zophobas morio]
MTFTERTSRSLIFDKIKIFNVIFSCSFVYDVEMSVVPHGAFASHKVRQNEEKLKNQRDACDLTPPKYSSKYMNSVWGMYNRYSVHNFKKNMDEQAFAFTAHQQDAGPKQSVEKTSTDLKGSLSSAKNLLPTGGFLHKY